MKEMNETLRLGFGLTCRVDPRVLTLDENPQVWYTVACFQFSGPFPVQNKRGLLRTEIGPHVFVAFSWEVCVPRSEGAFNVKALRRMTLLLLMA
jgi:hypothetical protein